MPSAPPTITVGMIARPSSPSVRLTAFEVPTMTKKVSTTKPTAPSGYAMCLKNGTISWFSAGIAWVSVPRYSAADSPISACQKNFQRAGRPRGLRCTTLR
jgi:hypothetical protein